MENKQGNDIKFSANHQKDASQEIGFLYRLKSLLSRVGVIETFIIILLSMFFANINVSAISLMPALTNFLSHNDFVIFGSIFNFTMIYLVFADWRFRSDRKEKFKELSKSEAASKNKVDKEAEISNSTPDASPANSDDKIKNEMDKYHIGQKNIIESVTLPGHDLIAENLNKRVSSLQARSTLIYWTIIITIIAGISIIMLSGYLSLFESPIYQAWNHISQVADKKGYNINDQETQDIRKAQIDIISKEIENAKVAAESNGKINPVAITLKLTIAGLLVLLVQILIQLYRFNTKLIVFYSSRRDCIVMSEGDIEKAKEWAELFAPTNLDFGKEPRHPFQEIAEIFRKSPSKPSKPENKSSEKDEALNPKTKRPITMTDGQATAARQKNVAKPPSSRNKISNADNGA